jgi:hypothetical protein
VRQEAKPKQQILGTALVLRWRRDMPSRAQDLEDKPQADAVTATLSADAAPTGLLERAGRARGEARRLRSEATTLRMWSTLACAPSRELPEPSLPRATGERAGL